jgi:formylglycine-generating enzyme required for sulfatase activity
MRNLALMWVLAGCLLGCGGRETQGKPETANTSVADMPDDMVFVEGGTFTMGCTIEQGYDCSSKPAHSVTVGSFYLAKHEVTQKLWTAVMGENPIDAVKKDIEEHLAKTKRRGRWLYKKELHTVAALLGDNLPVVYVSWYDTQKFIEKLNAMSGKSYRLPTEAEWEFAARGGNKSKGYRYSGGNNVGDVAWYGCDSFASLGGCMVECKDGNSGGKTHPVGTKTPNELGLYDMSGNVKEWVNDWEGDYSSDDRTNPTGPSKGAYRILRGGEWGQEARYCKVSERNSFPPLADDDGLGFRLAHDP